MHYNLRFQWSTWVLAEFIQNNDLMSMLRMLYSEHSLVDIAANEFDRASLKPNKGQIGCGNTKPIWGVKGGSLGTRIDTHPACTINGMNAHTRYGASQSLAHDASVRGPFCARCEKRSLRVFPLYHVTWVICCTGRNMPTSCISITPVDQERISWYG